MNNIVPDTLVIHLQKEDKGHPLAYRCELPYYWKNSILAERNITPIFECGITVAYYNNDLQRYEKYCLEDDPQEITIYTGYQQLMAELFVYLYEDGASEEDLKSCASICVFTYLENMLAEIKTYTDYEEWKLSFFKKCV